MIGNIAGEVLFSDGSEAIILTNSGIGYQLFCNEVLVEGSSVSIFISHVIKEASEELYGFRTLREKKMFEMLTSVKGVGPKSAYALTSSLSADQIITSVMYEDKKTLTKAPGIGNKAASQMILDLSGKIAKIKMYSNSTVKVISPKNPIVQIDKTGGKQTEMFSSVNKKEDEQIDPNLLQDAILACKELGFKEENIIPLAHDVLANNVITKAEQLVHLVLKEV